MDIDTLKPEEVVALLGDETLLGRVRKILSSEYGRIEQAGSQRRSLSPVELRRMELKAAQRIIDTVLAGS